MVSNCKDLSYVQESSLVLPSLLRNFSTTTNIFEKNSTEFFCFNVQFLPLAAFLYLYKLTQIQVKFCVKDKKFLLIF